MKRILFVLLSVLALIACKKNNEPQQPGNPSTDVTPSDTVQQDTIPGPVAFSIELSYDSSDNIITAVSTDSMVEYVLQVWMKEDFIMDYGDDFSDAHIAESLQSYLDMCVEGGIQFPTFVGNTALDVYEFFDQPYPGKEIIAMAAKFNMTTLKIEGPVYHIFFTTPE